MHRCVISSIVVLVASFSFLLAQPATRLPFPSPASYGTGSWNSDSLGNHRVVLRVAHTSRAPRAAHAVIPWRRRDLHPESKQIVIIDGSSGRPVRNVHWFAVTREVGDVVFETPTIPGVYYVYYLLYRAKGSRNYPRGYYLPFTTGTNQGWLDSLGLSPSRNSANILARIPPAQVIQFQSIDEFNSFYPMEVIATQGEVTSLLRSHPRADHLVFAEPRTLPIKMTADIPFHWARKGEQRRFAATAERGEFFTFQIGVLAANAGITIRGARMTDLRSPGRSVIPAASYTCFNTGGTDWAGKRFTKAIQVARGHVQPLWMGVQVPPGTPAGTYSGSVEIAIDGSRPRPVSLSLTVAPTRIVHQGDDEPSRLTRLRWLNSQLASDDSLIRPFTPVAVRGRTLSVLGRDLRLTPSGLPEQITSYFAPEITHLLSAGRELLIAPAALVLEPAPGLPYRWDCHGLQFVREGPGIVTWRATSRAGVFDISVDGQLECDGYADFRVTLLPREDVAMKDIRLEVPIANTAARYVMGMGLKGGNRPESFRWHWDQTRNQDAIWLGDVNAGFQLSLRDTNYLRPLNTNFYLSQPLQLPPSWYNEDRGSLGFNPRGDTLALAASSGSRVARAGTPLHFFFSMLITPFKTIATDAQWSTRFFHKFQSLASIKATGANTINVHHATEINPFINYPFLRPRLMKSYIDDAHAQGFRVKIYYTVRELANRAPELFALRSFGNEVLSHGPGGGYSWLQEHLDSNYIAAWFVPELSDAALINSGISRWHNYYVEGLHWLVENVGIDGLYIDDVAFDRMIMKRVRKVLDRGRPDPLIDLHSANQFNPRDGFASSANLYMEHFPYLNRLWFGEYFDYDSPPDYWLIEISGIPFGLMGEMLEKGGNPWRGMLYGMTARLPWAGDPTPVWKIWDQFGMEGSRMIGYWSPSSPVRTGNPDVLATSYVKSGRTLLSIASWAPAAVSCVLAIDWQQLGLDPARVSMRAPASAGFQDERTVNPGDSITVDPGKGVLLILEETHH